MPPDLHEVLTSLGIGTSAARMAMEMEQIALKDDYFISRSSIRMSDSTRASSSGRSASRPRMFTPCCSARSARTVGWIAQWKEMIEDPDQKSARRVTRYQPKQQQ